MSDGGWYGYPPQEPDPHGQPQDDWNRPPLDYGNAPQAPGYDQYGQAGQGGADPQAYYGQQQPPQQPRPRPRPQPQQPGQQYRPQQPPPPQSQNPYLQQPGQGQGQGPGQGPGPAQGPGQGYDSGSYPTQQYPAGRQPAAGYEGYPQAGYETGGGRGRRSGQPGPDQSGGGYAQGYESPGYDSRGYDAQGHDPAAGREQSAYGSGSYDTPPPGGARPAGGGGSRRRKPPAEEYGEQRSRDPYHDLAGLSEGADEYEYPTPGRGVRGAGSRPARPGEPGTGTQPKVADEGRFPLLGREGDETGRSADEDRDEDGDDDGEKKGRKNKKKARRGCLAIFVIFALVAGGVGFEGYKYYEAHYGPPADYSSSTGTAQTVVVTIPDDATGNEIGQILFAKGVIKSERAFTKACDANSQCSSVQANTYQLHEQMSAAGALTALLDPGNVYNKAQLLVRPGERAADVFADLEQKTGWTQAQIVSAISSGQVDLPGYAKAKPGTNFPFANVEGMLFTGTYQLPDYKTPTLLIKAMIDKQLAMFQAVGLTQKASSLDMTPYQVLTVASMARAEAGSNPADLSKIAGVIYTRLKNPQYSKLGFDTSTLYGLGRTSPQPTGPELADASNPYNLRQIAGLPPGPIDSVDQTALTSALAPTDSTDVYFCAVDGTVYYAANNTAWDALGQQHPGDCG